MSVITSSRGVELLRQAAEPGKHERQIVNARRGREQQWMGLAEAVSIVVNAEGVYLRDDARSFQLMVECSPGGDIYQFDIDLWADRESADVGLVRNGTLADNEIGGFVTPVQGARTKDGAKADAVSAQADNGECGSTPDAPRHQAAQRGIV